MLEQWNARPDKARRFRAAYIAYCQKRNGTHCVCENFITILISNIS